MAESVIVSVLGMIMVIGALFRRPVPIGFIASLAISLSPAYGVFLIEGTGLFSVLLILVLLSAFSRPWNSAFQYIYPLGLLLLLSFIIAVRDIYDDNGPNAAFILATVSIIMFFTAIIGTGNLRDGFIPGFIVGGTFLALTETLRVVQGGAQHAKAVSFDVNPIVLAQFIAISFIGSLILLLRDGWRWSLVFSAFISLAGIIATGSRGPMLAVALATLLILILGTGRETSKMSSIVVRLIVVFYTSLVCLIIARGFFADVFAEWWRLDDSDGNASSRWRAWESAWYTFTSNPLLGAGAGNYYYGEPAVEYGLPSYPHQMLLEVGAEYGLGAAVLLIAAVVAVFKVGGVSGSPFVLLAVVTFSLSGSISTSLVFGVCLAIALVVGKQSKLATSGVIHRGNSDVPVRSHF